MMVYFHHISSIVDRLVDTVGGGVDVRTFDVIYPSLNTVGTRIAVYVISVLKNNSKSLSFDNNKILCRV